MTTTPAKKRGPIGPRKKPTTVVGKQILADVRKKLAEEEAELAERMVIEARKRRQAPRQSQGLTAKTKRHEHAVRHGIVRRVHAVLQTEAVDVPIRVRTGRFSAWTDYTSITVSLDNPPENPTDLDVRLFAATLRGALYHEGGHCRWSNPFENLRREAMAEYVASGVPMPVLTGLESKHLHQAWNGLEDQRMETAVVTDSPRKAAYFTPMVMQVLCVDPNTARRNWPLLIWRRYLPRHIRDGARQLFVDWKGFGNEDLALRFEMATDLYVHATDVVTMWQAVVLFAECMREYKGTMDMGDMPDHPATERPDQVPTDIPINPDFDDEDEDEDNPEWDEDEDEDGDMPDEDGDVPTPGSDADADDDAEEGDDQDGPTVPGEGDPGDEDAEEGEPSKGDVPAPDEDGEGESESDDTGKGGKGAGSGTPDLTQDDIDQAIADAEAERNADTALNGDVDAYHDTYGEVGSMLDRHASDNAAWPAEVTNEALGLAVDIENAFQARTMDKRPAWIEQQRRGVLNVSRYRTRQPGDTEVWKQWIDHAAPGHNVAVSVLLDNSGSMEHNAAALASTGFACKVACERLGIPCTVVLWNTKSTVLFDGKEAATSDVPPINAGGGTNPLAALEDLDNQRFGKELHLVIVMTDGEWTHYTGDRHVDSTYGAPGRTILGFAYSPNAGMIDTLTNKLHSYGVHQVFGSTRLNTLALRMEDAILDMVV